MVTQKKARSSPQSSFTASGGAGGAGASGSSKPSSSSRRGRPEADNLEGAVSAKLGSKTASGVIELDAEDDDGGQMAKGEEENDDDDDNDDDDEAYEVERIVDHKKMKGTWYYRVKWLGYPDEENTWEPEEHMQNPETIANYWKSLPSNRQPGRQAQHQAAKRRRSSQSGSRTSSPQIHKRGNAASNNGKGNNGSGGREQPSHGHSRRGGGPAPSPMRQQTAPESSASGIRAPPEEVMDEDKMDEDVDDATWNSMEKEWIDRYDHMDSWDDVLVRVNTIERDPDGEVKAFLQFPGKVRLIYPLAVARQKCPQHLLSFYEAHIRFRYPKPAQARVSSSEASEHI